MPSFIEPHLGEFARRHPLIRLEVVVDDGLGDIVRDGCDAAIRLLEAVPDSMIAIPVTPPVAMAVVASPAYVAANQPPAGPEDLARHNRIGYRQTASAVLYRREFTDPGDGRDLSIEPQGHLVTNSDDVMTSAALRGSGWSCTWISPCGRISPAACSSGCWNHGARPSTVSSCISRRASRCRPNCAPSSMS
ncbi:LysR substrate-binding domain-containing protein [Roseomonas sp. OT10]|uniref:LysR substrate-binding domain-containing protein n=1 Tax=Roseomonas cutis TaxID=2897332 RepID=UPI001E580C65|nr:LysR substrate-binding domain-containing protein [Roseomonas sp. OT10]UFN49837.1 LysR substrate-binding domain-containing protein [Roseomonas sp. OT10]